jgi:hypothetical protein
MKSTQENKIKNKIKFGNTKLGLPSLNEAKSKEGHPTFSSILSQVSKKSIFKTVILLCIHPLPDNN